MQTPHMTISPEFWTAIASIVLAVVAFATVLRDELRYWLQHPKFSVKFDTKPPDCQRVPLDLYARSPEGVPVKVDSAETHYVRARIRNDGSVGARDVEVKVVQVRRQTAGGGFKRLELGTPWNLVWAHLGTHVLQHLPRKAEWHIDIGHVVDPAKRRAFPGEDKPESDRDKTIFCLAFFVKSNTLEHLLDPMHKYEIEFRVYASNARASGVFTIHLNHTGNWFLSETEMFRDGLGLSITG